ncbi:hypothetical protein RV08_GL001184 [Enterococcus mundtii]|nr:hypothetical protein RV08_GL001184 [Enterococcus mundtii]
MVPYFSKLNTSIPTSGCRAFFCLCGSGLPDFPVLSEDLVYKITMHIY